MHDYVNYHPRVPRLLSSWVRTETVPGHCAVVSLSWSPHGDLLVSASPVDAHLVVWDVMLGVATRIPMATGGGLGAVTWSPDGRRVLAASTSSVFRVWESQSWTCDKWTNSSSRCKASLTIGEGPCLCVWYCARWEIRRLKGIFKCNYQFVWE